MDALKYREIRNRFDLAMEAAIGCYANGHFAAAGSFFGRVAAIARELQDICEEESHHEHSRR